MIEPKETTKAPKNIAPASSSTIEENDPKIVSVPSTTVGIVPDASTGSSPVYFDTGVKWSIMILTQPSRTAYLARLQAVLKPQLVGGVEMDVATFDPKLSLGENRQKLIESAKGQYVNFIDDDDLIPNKYVAMILPLLDGVDYIGYRVQMFTDGVKQKPTFHSLIYDKWTSDEKGFYRDISHINPIRRELALKVKMSGGHGEDQRWADQLRSLGIVKTQHYIDEVMYSYYFRSARTEAATAVQVETHAEGPAIQRKGCPKCGSTATGMAGGMRHCNQCGYRF